MPGDRVGLDVAHSALVLALGPRPVRCARPWSELPVRGERQEPLVELHLARRRVVAHHQRLRVVHQHLVGDPAEVPERVLKAAEPRCVALVLEHLDVRPPGVSQRRHEQVRTGRFACDRYPRLAKIDLQLTPGRRLEAQRRLRLGRQQPPISCRFRAILTRHSGERYH